MESNVDNHLWLTWYSLVETKQELGNLKDLRQKYLKVQQVNAKLTQSSAEFRDEIRDLSTAVKRLEAQNAKQVKQIEDLTRKLERGSAEEKVSVERRTSSSSAGKRVNDDIRKFSTRDLEWSAARKQRKWLEGRGPNMKQWESWFGFLLLLSSFLIRLTRMR